MPHPIATRQLGCTGIHVSPVGLGTMQFSGRGLAGAMFPELPEAQVDQIIKKAIDGGITWFDTAERYGHGTSERALSRGLERAGIEPGEVTIATKWSPVGRRATSVERTIDDRVTALAPFPIDVHQIHFGFGCLSPVREQVRAMARLVEAQRIRAVGVSNFSARQMEIAHATLAEHRISLATNQIKLSLLYRTIETNGVLDAARRLGITLVAWSPLDEGILTGKFHDDRGLVDKVPRVRRTLMGISRGKIDRSAPLIEELRAIATRRSATISQIALAWVIAYYGDIVVAIPGASKPHHAEQAADAMRIALDQDEIERLAHRSDAVSR